MARQWIALLLAFSGILAVRPAAAQEPFPPVPELPSAEAGDSEDRLETDRDSFTPSTRPVGRSRLVVESSYSFIDNRDAKETHSFPELLLRYGLTERLELRFGGNYEIGGESNTVSGTGSQGDEFGPIRRRRRAAEPSESELAHEAQLSYGFKALLTRQGGLLPESSMILQGTTPTSGAGTDTLPTVTYVFGWELADEWKLDAAMRYAGGSEEEDRFDIFAPSVVLRVPLGERVNVHAEYFGLFSRDRADDFQRHFFSPGIHYLATPNFEVGVRAGWGLNDQSARCFVNTGVGLRF
jgi:hypothetical protein